MKEKDEVLNGILQSADRHPNSKVSKLIRIVESERTQKNIVMLLIELAENVEYATDFGISLKYYLDLFERLGLGRDIMLNETGLLLLNSSKIYSRRVDFVHELIERQILTLSNADREIADAKNIPESSAIPEKPKRGRKRLLEAPKDPYEVALAPKKFRKISHEKRFAVNSTNAANARANQLKLKSQMRHTESEQNIHPAGWVYSSIVDLENDEEIDSKRNYKLFTYHVEHRYNTLVPDINFRLHFMVKDFIDEEEEQLEEEFKESGQYPTERATTWPPLSEAYVEQYLQLENKLLQCGEQPRRKKANAQVISPQREINNPQYKTQESANNLISTNIITNSEKSNVTVASEEIDQNLSQCNETHFNDEACETAETVQNDSGLSESISEDIDASAIVEVNYEQKDSNISCELVAEELSSLEAIDSQANNQNEKEADCAEIPKLVSAQIISNTEEIETIASSVLDTSINISDNMLNSTSINSSTMSSNESICTSNAELSTSKINANESITSATTNLSNTTVTTDHSKESAKNISNTEEREANSSSVLDTSTNISDNMFNSTAINSSTMSSDESICTSNVELSTSKISANESITSATTNLRNTTVTTDTSSNFIKEMLEYDSALGSSMIDSNTLSLTQELESGNTAAITETQSKEHIDSTKKEVTEILSLDEDLQQKNVDHEINEIDEDKSEIRINLPTKKRGLRDDTQINLDEIRIHLPHLDDEGVFFSDLDEQDQRMLSPTVMALDVFPRLNNKKNFTIIVDDDIRAMLNFSEEPETYVMPQEKRSVSPTLIELNIMELPEKMLRRRLLFKLGTEYDLFLQARMRKRKRADEPPARECRPPKQMKWFHLNDTNMNGVHVSPLNSPGHSSEEFNGFSDDNDSTLDFYGFPEDDQTTLDEVDTNHHRLSRDSGVDGVDGPITIDKTSLSTITEEELEETAQLIKNSTDTEENITEATSANSNECNTQATETNSSENIEINIASDEIILQTEVLEENIEPLSQEVEKDAVNDESLTNVLDIVDKSSANIGDIGLDLDTTNELIFNMVQITEGQNLDDLLDNDDNDTSADEVIEEVVNDKETCALSQIENGLKHTLEDIDINSSKTKIQKWHEHLQPILSKSRERHHFDVFQIGTEIMNELEEGTETQEENVSPKCISFQDVMENKDESYVSRYFLSSLLLANQSNIKITVANKSSEEPTAWKDIKFDLLSTKRHTVSIEDNIGMVKKSAISEVPKLKAATPQLKRSTKNPSTKNYRSTIDSSVPTSSLSCSSTQITQQEMQSFQLVKVNLDVVKPLKHIEKLPRNGDDYDSGIFSSEELM